MHLKDHLEAARISQNDFGAMLAPPASQGLVSQWIRGVTRITLDYALQIDRASGGNVTPQDCAAMYSESSARTALPT